LKSDFDKLEILTYLSLISEKIEFFKLGDYSNFLKEAANICLDIDDIDYFALALKLNCPIWSQDRDLKEQKKIKVYTTKELVEELNI